MSESRSLDIAVIGGGLGGLAATCTLAARGHRVTCFERNNWLGGKAAVLHRDGYRFDMGPTIVTVPSVLERIFSEAGRPLTDHLELTRLDPQWRCFYQDGSQLDLADDPGATAQTIAQFTGSKSIADGYRRFMRISRELSELSERFFFWRSVGSIGDTFEPGSAFRLSVLPALLRLRMGHSVAGLVRGCVRDQRVAQMLDHMVQYVGSSPELAPAVLCGIADMQAVEGITYPRIVPHPKNNAQADVSKTAAESHNLSHGESGDCRGTAAVPVALGRLAEELGATLRTGTQVAQILTDATGRQVTGIETADGECLHFDRVVSNMDSVRTHTDLLPPQAHTARDRFLRRRRYEPACSGVVLYLGLSERYDHLAHHNFVFSRDAHEEFTAIYQKGEPAPDPTCYVCAPSSTDPSVAPHGGEALYVLVHTPHLRAGHDWSEMLPRYRDVILRKLATTGQMADIESRIRCEHTLTPQNIHERYQVLDGAIYGLASHGRWTGAFKPPNRSRDVAGLYMAGGSAHPGPGMPMALMSGWIAADTLDMDT